MASLLEAEPPDFDINLILNEVLYMHDTILRKPLSGYEDVLSVAILGRRHPSELGGTQRALERGGAALGERCQHRRGKQGRVPNGVRA